MKRLTIPIMATLMAGFLLIFSCSDDNAGGRYPISALYVYSVAPTRGASNVYPDEPLTISFSMPIDQGSFTEAGAFTIESLGMSESLGDIQAVDTWVSFLDAGQTVQIMPPSRTWTNGRTYRVTLTSRIRSLAGDPLEPETWMFSVGTAYGVYSVEGRPYVTSMTAVTATSFPYDCLAFIVEFNEDLKQWPNADVRLLEFGTWSGAPFVMLIKPMWEGDNRHFYIYFNYPDRTGGFGCDPDYFTFGKKFRVKIFNAYDTNNELMVEVNPNTKKKTSEKEFSWPDDYRCTNYLCSP